MKLLLFYLLLPMLLVLLLAQMLKLDGKKLEKYGWELITLQRYLLALLLAPLP